MRAYEMASLISLVLLVLAYMFPYTLMRDLKSWELYIFWTLLSLIALIASWLGVGSWRRGLS